MRKENNIIDTVLPIRPSLVLSYIKVVFGLHQAYPTKNWQEKLLVMATVAKKNELEWGKGASTCQKIDNHPNKDQCFCHAHINGMVHFWSRQHTLTPLEYRCIGMETTTVSACHNNPW